MPSQNPTRRGFLLASAGVAATAFLPSIAFAGKFFDDGTGFGASGYDVVAYFTQSKPVKGKDAFTSEYDGVRYRFASAGHKDLFDGDPAKYAPQYGGYCAFAVSRGYTAPTVPEAWSVHEDKLYLNFSKTVRARWALRKGHHIKSADANWPGLSA